MKKKKIQIKYKSILFSLPAPAQSVTSCSSVPMQKHHHQNHYLRAPSPFWEENCKFVKIKQHKCESWGFIYEIRRVSVHKFIYFITKYRQSSSYEHSTLVWPIVTNNLCNAYYIIKLELHTMVYNNKQTLLALWCILKRCTSMVVHWFLWCFYAYKSTLYPI